MANRRSGKKIDNVRWLSFFQFNSTMVAGSVAATVLAAGVSPETLLRIRGEFCAYLDAALSPGRGLRLTAGMILVPDGTGTTVLWEPNGDAAAPWLWYSAFFLGYEEYVVDVIDSPVISAKRVEIDNKAMRRIRPDQELQIVVTSNTIAATANVNWILSARGLLGS